MKPAKTATYFYSLLIILTTTLSCQDITPKAAKIITNANIWTGNSNQPTASQIR